MATEKILMACVEKGESRQAIHEIIKVHSVAAGRVVKEEGKDNDLLKRLGDDPGIPFSEAELMAMIGDAGHFTGRAKEQTEEFIAEVVDPVLDRHRKLLSDVHEDINV